MPENQPEYFRRAKRVLSGEKNGRTYLVFLITWIYMVGIEVTYGESEGMEVR